MAEKRIIEEVGPLGGVVHKRVFVPKKQRLQKKVYEEEEREKDEDEQVGSERLLIPYNYTKLNGGAWEDQCGNPTFYVPTVKTRGSEFKQKNGFYNCPINHSATWLINGSFHELWIPVSLQRDGVPISIIASTMKFYLNGVEVFCEMKEGENDNLLVKLEPLSWFESCRDAITNIFIISNGQFRRLKFHLVHEQNIRLRIETPCPKKIWECCSLKAKNIEYSQRRNFRRRMARLATKQPLE